MKTRKHLVFSCVIVIALFFLPAALWAATPQIDSLDGKYIDGQDITINGSWAPDGDETPLLWDNFESGIVGSTLSTTPQRGSWTFNSTPTPTVYSNNYSHSGKQSAYTATTANGRGNVNVSGLETMDKIYWSFWFRFNDGGASGEQTKLFQLWGNGTRSCDYGPGVMSGGFSDGWFATYNIASGSDCDTGRVQANYGLSPSQNNWNFGEMILQRSSNYGVSDGTVIVRINNQTVYNQVGNLLTRMNGEDWQLAKFFYGFTNDGGKGNFSIDDAYINDSWSRVVLGDKQTYSSCTELNIQPVTQWSDTAITFTANQGSFQSGDQAYLFVVDSSGQISSGFPITIGQGSITDSSPSLAITSPISSGSYSMETMNDQEVIMLGGTASDDVLVESVSYSTDNGQSGIADTSDGYAAWSAPITVNKDETVVATVTATDSAGNTTSKAITITVIGVDGGGGGANIVGWDANVQTGDSTWSDSSVTYCVRLMVEGDNITNSATQVALAFQGRSSGSYTIRNVSIAERDLAGSEGDVIDSTWTQVFFNGAAWNSIVTVPSGSETLSDPLNLKLNPGTDYYVTFKIETPSVYLDPPSGYTELIFYSEDRTRDIDWGGNGHDIIQDFHALSKIYVIDATNAPPVPSLEMAP